MRSLIPADTLMRAWQRKTPLAIALLPLSWIYRSLVGMRRALYTIGWFRQVSLPVPVIVVGNIFVGGTGKTPFVIWLVEQLRERGFRPGVISRGYGAEVETVIAVHDNSLPSEVGDEPLLIAQKTRAPVVVGRRRVNAARRLLELHTDIDVIISDDGLQHYELGRSVEIQMSDARGHGNGWLLPAGPLREPASRRSDFYVVNGFVPDALRSSGMTLDAEYAERISDRSQRMLLSSIAKGTRVVAAAGIGNPGRFFDMLRANGVMAMREIALPDHFDFSMNPFAQLDADLILMTDKDAVKCVRIDALAADPRLWTVPVSANIAGPLADKIVEKLRGHTTA
jgi:tetraacyldisaccharide 4'-kinase